MINQIFKLISSSALGQIITLAVLLTVARFVDPAVYGEYLVMLTIITYIVVIASGKYHHAIFLLDDNDSECLAKNIKYFCIFMAIVSTSVMYLLNVIFDLWPGVAFTEFILICTCGALSANYLFYYYLSVKNNEISKITKSRLVSPLIGGVFMLFFAYNTNSSSLLLLATLITLAFSNYFLISNRKMSYPDSSDIGLLSILNKHKKFPIYLLPSGLLETMNASYLLLAVNYFYGLEYAAFVGMYYRLIVTPQGIICSAISDIYRKKIIELKKETDIARWFFFRTIFVLTLLSCIVSILFYFFSSHGISLLLGDKWEACKQIFIIFTPLFFISFIVQPVSSILYAADGQKYDLFIQTTLSTMLILLVFFGENKSFESFLSLYILVLLFKYLLELFCCYRCLVTYNTKALSL